MIYEYHCQSCGDSTDRQVRVAYRNDPKPCLVEGCEGSATRFFNPENSGFVLKGYGWPSRDSRANKSMKAKQRAAKAKARDNNWTPSLQPNFNGQSTGTWNDAQDAAHQHNAQKPECPVDVSSFDGRVEKERQAKPRNKAAKTVKVTPVMTTPQKSQSAVAPA